MKSLKLLLASFCALIIFGLAITSCQKLDRPKLKELILDPPPPPYSTLKSYWTLDGTTRDTGQYRAPTDSKNITFVPGIAGQAAKVGADGYMAVPLVNDSLKTPGSITIAFWMNGTTGPVQGGAQGVFAISNSTQFWGNLEIFLENYVDATDPNAVYMKIHMFNASVTGGGEQWLQDDNVKLKNVLGKWTHIALTYNAATSMITLYKDGVATGINNLVLGGGTYGNLKFDNVTGIVLGSFAFQTSPSFTNHGPEGWAKSFDGALDNFRIYNVALSPAEVNNLYTNKL